MFTLNSYLRAVEKGMRQIVAQTEDIQERKRLLVQQLGLDLKAPDQLLDLIQSQEMPIIDQIRTQSHALISHQHKIMHLVDQENLPRIAYDVMFEFLIRNLRNFRELRKSVRREELILQRKSKNFRKRFARERRREEITYNRLAIQSDNILNTFTAQDIIPFQSVTTIRISSPFRKVAMILVFCVIFVHKVMGGLLHYIVKPDETFDEIYYRYKTRTIPYEHLIDINTQVNPNFNPAKLSIGQEILFPLRGEVPKQERKYHHPGHNFRDEAANITFARMLFGEGLGCSDEGIGRLASVVMYRLYSPSFPKNVHDVLLAKGQFKTFNPSRAVYPKLQDPERYAPREWQQCLRIADNFLGKKVPLPVTMATHFFVDINTGWGTAGYLYVDQIPDGKGGNFYLFVDENEKISENFRIREFAFKGCTAITIDIRIAPILERIRTESKGKPVIPVKVRGAGERIYTDAVDVIIKGATPEDMQAIAKSLGLNYQDGAIHVQVGNKPIKANMLTEKGVELEKKKKKATNPQSKVQFTFPLKTYKAMGDGFGPREIDVEGASKNHKGIDVKAKRGTPVYSIATGKVYAINRNSRSAGKLIIIDHQNGYMSEYMHLSSINVTSGQMVDTTTIIGKVGSSGISSGNHLHLGVFKGKGATGYNQRKSNFIDPFSVMPTKR